ncbi:carboxypeptidase-like protein [Tenacibaculum adriaticum]|uniref:Carboxypeptidase-like protein n=1 Tax=Tenacibaculum adriaticum TaxID=413713 RepID=A0A5S5DWL6_9FLAO|nr:DUF5686 and carboxypeptidase regulatory-like domain-containing protein [Tenacibaculum adriaticum]TYP99668.1 carboxypeptidase-like protein [Tenacibaculum adriaticum]
MKKVTLLLFVFTSIVLSAQIKGKVTDKNNQPLPYVSIYLESSLTGTTTNDNGWYELDLKKPGKHTIVFQFLGFKTIKKTVNVDILPLRLNAQMTEEQEFLNEVEVSSKENPANKIIRSVIANKEKNANKAGKYTADFYSRGLFKIKDAPKKILGREIGDLGGGLDSTRSGIIYLSETISKITYQKKPKNFKEIIIASKVSGRDNGISFNRAAEVNFNLYKNQVPVANANLFSPISDYAFSYYRFKLEGSFYDKNNKLIDKIKLIPRRENDRVFGGHIYIVEDDWAVYGADLTATGAQINNPAIDVLHLKQNYNYDAKTKIWAIILQTIDFKVGFLGFNMKGRFSASYSNYNFEPNFTENTFDKEILSFEKDATKKDSVYWNALRSVPLTLEEKKDYIEKDSIKLVHNSKKYLDSVDTQRNKLKMLSPVLGYSYQNSNEKWNIDYSGILKNLGFNTIQGYNSSIGFKYSKKINDYGNNWNTSIDVNYGFSEKKLRPVAYFSKSWNNFDKPRLNISTGITATQFDDRNPISNFYNSIYTLFGKRNYAKYYEKSFAKVDFSQELTTGIRFYSSLEYAHRKPLFNTTDYSFFNKDRIFETNNPVNPTGLIAPFNEHNIFTAEVSTRIYFGNKYITYPNARYTVRNHRYPTLSIGYRKTFGSDNINLHSDLIFSRLQQNLMLGNLGDFDYNLRGGLFLNKKDIAFMDYYHPLGNEIDLAPKNRMSSFNLLPYYEFSTNDKYGEIHTQHNFKGFLLGKIPLLNKLNFHTIVSAKSYFSGERKPYTEYSIGLDNIGWGKWRFLRVDYVQSNYNGNKQNGFVFGISLFD